MAVKFLYSGTIISAPCDENRRRKAHAINYFLSAILIAKYNATLNLYHKVLYVAKV